MNSTPAWVLQSPLIAVYTSDDSPINILKYFSEFYASLGPLKNTDCSLYSLTTVLFTCQNISVNSTLAAVLQIALIAVCISDDSLLICQNISVNSTPAEVFQIALIAVYSLTTVLLICKIFQWILRQPGSSKEHWGKWQQPCRGRRKAQVWNYDQGPFGNTI